MHWGPKKMNGIKSFTTNVQEEQFALNYYENCLKNSKCISNGRTRYGNRQSMKSTGKVIWRLLQTPRHLSKDWSYEKCRAWCMFERSWKVNTRILPIGLNTFLMTQVGGICYSVKKILRKFVYLLAVRGKKLDRNRCQRWNTRVTCYNQSINQSKVYRLVLVPTGTNWGQNLILNKTEYVWLNLFSCTF